MASPTIVLGQTGGLGGRHSPFMTMLMQGFTPLEGPYGKASTIQAHASPYWCVDPSLA